MSESQGPSLIGRTVALILLIGLLAGTGWMLFGGKKAGPTQVEPDPGFPRFISSVQCRSCHPDVFREWHGSHHQIAYLNPEVRKLSDDFRNKECQACHLPRPVSLTGYKKRTLPRQTTPEEGISCLTCHLSPEGRILARDTRDDAPCRPVANGPFVSVDLCESCHNQHKTTDQWRASGYFDQGITCNDCHMPAVDRGNADGKKRKGFHHGYEASHNRTSLRQAMSFRGRVDEDSLELTLHNDGAGHNLPTEERSRAIDIMVRWVEKDGSLSEWHQAHRFRLPYRDEPLPDTTLPAGESYTVSLPIDFDRTAADVALYYRLNPFSTDDQPSSTKLYAERFVWVDEQGQRTQVAEKDIDESPETERDRQPPWVPVRDESWIEKRIEYLARQESTRLQTPEASTTSDLVLTEKMPELMSIASSRATMTELKARRLADLVEMAFTPNLVSERRARQSYESLMQEPLRALALEQGLLHDNGSVRTQCAYELGEIGNQSSLVPLLLRFKDEQEPTVLLWLVSSIAKLGNLAGLETLRWLMQQSDTSNDAGLKAIEICKRWDVSLSENPTYAELDERLRDLEDQWKENGQMGEEVVEATEETRARVAAQLVRLQDFQLRGVDEARFVVGRLGVLGLPLVEQVLFAKEPYLRTHSLEILRHLGPVGASLLDEVVLLLEEPLTRVDAAKTLGAIADRRAAEPLRELLGSEDVELRTVAVESLGRVGSEEDVPRLEAIWSDADQPLDVRVRAAFGLSLLSEGHDALTWLKARLDAGDYHESTLRELLSELPN